MPSIFWEALVVRPTGFNHTKTLLKVYWSLSLYKVYSLFLWQDLRKFLWSNESINDNQKQNKVQY